MSPLGRRLALFAPLVVLVVGAIYSASNVAALPFGWRLAFPCVTSLAAIAFCMLFSSGVRPRGAALVTLVTILATPIGSGIVTGFLAFLRTWGDPTKAFERGVLASIVVVGGMLPATILVTRRAATVRALWIVAATTVAFEASALWSAPDAHEPYEPTFDAISWTPPPMAWADEARGTLWLSACVIGACALVVLLVALRDRSELGRVGARTAAGLFFVVCAAMYLFVRVAHLEANTDVAALTSEGGRPVAVPSLRSTCERVERNESWSQVDARLRRSMATSQRLDANRYRWRPPKGDGRTSACEVTFESFNDFSWARRADYRAEAPE